MCSDTQELRVEHGIEDAVTYRIGHSSVEASSPSILGEGRDEDADDARQHLMESDKEELVSSVIRLQEEVGKSNKIIKSLRLQRN